MSRILIAEDDPHILRVISLWLSRLGHETLEARNGTMALELFAVHRPDILLTDVNMPGMDGIELLEMLGQTGHQPQGIIVLTNRWDHREIGERIAHCNVHVVPKPFSPSALADLIGTLQAEDRQSEQKGTHENV